jgi:predicted membrane metal-binding protein
LITFTAASIYTSTLLSMKDPLEAFATSPYNNVEETKPEDAPVITGKIVKARPLEYGRTEYTVSSGGRKILLTVKEGSSYGANHDGETFAVRNQTAAEASGRNITFTGKIRIPPEERNPGTFNRRLQLRIQGIFVTVESNAGEVHIGELRDPFTHFIAKAKSRFCYRAAREIGEKNAGLLCAMLFGDKNGIDEDSDEDFR